MKKNKSLFIAGMLVLSTLSVSTLSYAAADKDAKPAISEEILKKAQADVKADLKSKESDPHSLIAAIEKPDSKTKATLDTHFLDKTILADALTKSFEVSEMKDGKAIGSRTVKLADIAAHLIAVKNVLTSGQVDLTSPRGQTLNSRVLNGLLLIQNYARSNDSQRGSSDLDADAKLSADAMKKQISQLAFVGTRSDESEAQFATVDLKINTQMRDNSTMKLEDAVKVAIKNREDVVNCEN